MNQFVEDFLYKTLGGKNINKVNCVGDLVKICIRKAYADMLTGGRYLKVSLSELELNKIKTIFEVRNYAFQREMIDEVANIIFPKEIIKGDGGRYVTTYGLAQKIVNMAYKYFYVFNEYFKYPELKDIYKNCDCPLDSYILKSLNCSNLIWTKLTKEKYIEVQEIITKQVSPNHLGKLKYDFEHW